LQILGDVENDNLNPKRYQVEEDKTRRWQLWASLGIFAVLALGVSYWIFSDFEGTCPSFIPTSDFNIMILPFDNLDGSADRPHIKIREGIEKKIIGYQLEERADVETNLKKFEEGQGITQLDAESAALECNAKLVMWGSSERVGEEKEITANYKFLSNDGALNLTQLDIDETGTDIDTVRTISSIKSGGSLTLNVETIIKAFFGLISHELDRKADAVANLEEVVNALNPQDSNHLVFTNILAADYIAMGNKEKAIETYDKLLFAHPDYKLANVNQGMLLYEKGQYAEAIQKWDKAIIADPDNAKLIRTRGDAYAKDGQYMRAKDDYVAAKDKNKTNNPVFNTRISDIENKINSSRNRINMKITTPASGGVLYDPNKNKKQVAFYEKRAIESRKVGEYKKAVQYTSRILRLDKKNFVAYRILVEEQQLDKKNPAEAKKIFDKALKVGVDRKKMYDAFPEYKPNEYKLDRSKYLFPKQNLNNSIRLNN